MLDAMNVLVRIVVGCWLALAVACASTAPASPNLSVSEVPAAVDAPTPIPIETTAQVPAETVTAAVPEARIVSTEPVATADGPADNATDHGLPAEVLEGIPDGFELLSHAIGDLNLDGRLDVAIIVHEPGDADFGAVPDTVPPRPVLLFIAQRTGGFEMVTRSDGAALCGRCGGTFGDPFVDLTIDHGRLSIGHYGGSAWRWTYTPTFAYDIVENDWVLSGIGQTSFHAADPDMTIEDHSTTDVDPIVFSEFEANW